MNISQLHIIGLFPVILLVASCGSTNDIKSKKNDTNEGAEKQTVIVKSPSNITLHDKGLEVVQQHVMNKRWKLIYMVGGLTGKDRKEYKNTYVTIGKNEMLWSENGQEKKQKISWEPQRDITTGDSTYVITGMVNWKVDGIYNDTLRVADNYYDGFSYALVDTDR